jgi:hypothetical protein
MARAALVRSRGCALRRAGGKGLVPTICVPEGQRQLQSHMPWPLLGQRIILLPLPARDWLTLFLTWTTTCKSD